MEGCKGKSCKHLSACSRPELLIEVWENNSYMEGLGVWGQLKDSQESSQPNQPGQPALRQSGPQEECRLRLTLRRCSPQPPLQCVGAQGVSQPHPETASEIVVLGKALV